MILNTEPKGYCTWAARLRRGVSSWSNRSPKAYPLFNRQVEAYFGGAEVDLYFLATELAKEFSVSKPTISHHLTLLREAGLVRETYVQGSIALSLRRNVIEQLSRVGLTHLFGE